MQLASKIFDLSDGTASNGTIIFLLRKTFLVGQRGQDFYFVAKKLFVAKIFVIIIFSC